MWLEALFVKSEFYGLCQIFLMCIQYVWGSCSLVSRLQFYLGREIQIIKVIAIISTQIYWKLTLKRTFQGHFNEYD